jgi:hypothetical protein
MVWKERKHAKKNRHKEVQCPYCLLVRIKGYGIARHILSYHPEKVEEWIHADF